MSIRTVIDRIREEINEASEASQGAARSFAAWLNSPAFLTRFHATATLVWVLLLIPSVLWWKDLLVWVVIMSVWANIAGHWSSWQASRTERLMQKKDDEEKQQ